MRDCERRYLCDVCFNLLLICGRRADLLAGREAVLLQSRMYCTHPRDYLVPDSQRLHLSSVPYFPRGAATPALRACSASGTRLTTSGVGQLASARLVSAGNGIPNSFHLTDRFLWPALCACACVCLCVPVRSRSVGLYTC
jgi:hypothetical protein